MKLLTTNEAAQQLGVIRDRVCQYIRNNQLPAQKMGRDWLISEQDLIEFAKQPRKTGWKKGRPRKKEKA